MEIVLTLLSLGLVVLMSRDYRKGVIVSYLVNTFFIPGQENVVWGIRFKFVILATMIFFALSKRLFFSPNKGIIMRPAFFYFSYSFILALLATSVPLSSQIPFLIKMWIANFAFGIMLWYALASDKYILMFEKYFITILFVVTILGILEYITSINPFRLLFGAENVFFNDERGGLSGRISSATGHPLDWGQSCVILLGIVILLFYKLNSRKVILIECLIVINCVLTGSRSCIFPISILISLSLIPSLRTIKIKHLWKIVVGGGILLFIFAKMNSENVWNIQAVLMPWNTEKSENAGFKGSSLALREEQLRNSIAFIGEKGILFGLGYGLVRNRPEDDDELFENAFGLESIIFVTTIEQGVIGIICYVVFYFMLFVMCKQNTTGRVKIWILWSLFVCYFLSLVMTGARHSMSLFYAMLVVYVRHERFINSTICLGYEKSKSDRFVSSPISPDTRK